MEIKKRGRPKCIRKHPGDCRVRINTTVSPKTAEALEADRRPNEGQGQVIDRWADQATRKAEE